MDENSSTTRTVGHLTFRARGLVWCLKRQSYLDFTKSAVAAEKAVFSADTSNSTTSVIIADKIFQSPTLQTAQHSSLDL